MVDNVDITPGTGKTVAADEIGGILYQRVKPVWGVDGSAVDASATNPLPTVQTGGLPAGTNNIGDVDVLTLPALPAGEAHLGQVGGTTEIINTTLTLDTAIYASGEVLFDTTTITNAMRANDKLGILQSITIIDEDDQGSALDLIFFSVTHSIGTFNAAPTLTDADARDILGIVSFITTDFIDLGGCRVATRSGLGIAMRPAAGTRNVFVAGVLRSGTPTYTVNGLKLRCGFLQD